MGKTSIEWCDYTFNHVRGCTKVAAGCAHCYADTLSKRNPGTLGIWGPDGTRVVASESMWQQPLKWNREARMREVSHARFVSLSDPRLVFEPYERPRVFCASLADVFELRELTEWAEISDGYRIGIRGEIHSQWRSGGTRGEWQLMHDKVDSGGYRTIQLRKHPTLGDKTLKVHRLMLEAFVGKCPDGHVVRHLDGRRSNNVLWNLAYSTQTDNLADRAVHGTDLVGERNGRSKLTKSDVEEVLRLLSQGDSQSSIASKFGIKQVAVSRIKLGKSWNQKVPRVIEPIRIAVPGQLIDASGRPIFATGVELTSCPSGPSDTWVPATLDDVRHRLFALIDATPNLDWLLLTKRPENILRMWPVTQDSLNSHHNFHRPNVWIGTSIANQDDADRNIPHLLKCRDLAPVLFVSAEPLLGEISLRDCGSPGRCRAVGIKPEISWGIGSIDWVIAGGESGPHSRPMHPDWVRSIRDQCAAAGVPFLFKQHGEFLHESQWASCTVSLNAVFDNEHQFVKVGKKAAGRMLDGVIHDGYPTKLN